MGKVSAFLKRKDIVFSGKRYFIDAMGAMAQGLFCTLLIGTILNTLGTYCGIGFLNHLFTIKLGHGAGVLAQALKDMGYLVMDNEELEK